MALTRGATLSLFSLALLLTCSRSGYAVNTSDPAAPPPAAVERSAIGERSQDEALALQERLPAGTQQQLKAGEDSFLALWQAANRAKPEGIVILLPGDGESADWPQAIGPLRRKLPDAGWHSLSLTLPDTPGFVPETPATTPASTATSPDATTPEASKDSTTPADTATAASSAPITPEQHAERVLARIQAAVEFAQLQKVNSIILLGHGTGGYWAARYLSERQPPAIQNLLLVAATRPSDFNPPLEELVPPLRQAVGDFYYSDQDTDRLAAKQRLQASKRQQSPAYVQIAMKALPGDPATEQEQLYRRIRGWLSLHVQAQSSPQR